MLPNQALQPTRYSGLRPLPRSAEKTWCQKKLGNKLAIYFPAAITRAAGLHPGQRVRVLAHGNNVALTPLAENMLTLEQRLSLFNTKRHGGEAMAALPGIRKK